MEVTQLEPETIPARVAPEGLTRCPVCRELRGRALFPDPGHHGMFSEGTATCWCDGYRCGACGKGRVHQPISDYYDERSGHLIHVAYFMGMAPCGRCGEKDWRQVREG
jgi:hypothetical protein